MEDCGFLAIGLIIWGDFLDFFGKFLRTGAFWILKSQLDLDSSPSQV